MNQVWLRNTGYLPNVLLLFFFQGQQDEDLLQLLITVIDNELLKAVVLQRKDRRGKLEAKSVKLHSVRLRAACGT